MSRMQTYTLAALAGTIASPTALSATATITIDDPVTRMAVSEAEAAIFQLDITATTGTTVTLDVYIQHSIDGVVWDDFARFAQRTGTNGATSGTPPMLTWVAEGPTPETESRSATSTTHSMSAGVIQGPVGGQWRFHAVVTGTGSFTGTIKAALDCD